MQHEPVMAKDKVIQVVKRFARNCQHNKFILDDQLGYVKCGICGEQLNPMWVIQRFSDSEHRLFRHLEQLRNLVEVTKNKTRCKCEHCGKMTNIATEREVNKAFV